MISGMAPSRARSLFFSTFLPAIKKIKLNTKAIAIATAGLDVTTSPMSRTIRKTIRLRIGIDFDSTFISIDSLG
jgi:hypothetical protein